MAITFSFSVRIAIITVVQKALFELYEAGYFTVTINFEGSFNHLIGQ